VNLPTVYYVAWKDHSSSQGWLDTSEVLSLKPMVCHSVGYFISEDDEVLLLADTLSPSNQTNGRQYILKNCIIKRKKIKL
jgi:hypothetical protein